MAGTFTNLNYHITFSTKHRARLIDPELAPRLYAYMGGIIRADGGALYEVGGTSDHVHLLVRYGATRDVSSLLRDLKSRSSGWVHDTFRGRHDFRWQEGYGAFSVSYSQCGRVRKYIQGQEEHHGKVDFKVEFVRLLKAHACEYDERYIWD